MTTATGTTLIWRVASTAENFNWIKLISNGLDIVGVTLTADTGQIVLTGTTVPIPASADATFKMSGYQIRTLIAPGLPTLYLRFDYGVRRYVGFSTAANAVAPAIRISTGTSTDGAGNLTGVISDQIYALSEWGFSYSQELPGNATRPFFFSSDGQNYLTMSIDPVCSGSPATYRTSATPPLVFCFERSIAPDTGDYDGDGYVWVNPVGVIPDGLRTTDYLIANIPAASIFSIDGQNHVPAQTTLYFTSSGTAGATSLFPVTVCLPQPKAPMKSALYYYKADIADGYTLSTTVNGTPHTFIAAGKQQSASAVINYGAVSVALRYE